jgi:hypothetical protein
LAGGCDPTLRDGVLLVAVAASDPENEGLLPFLWVGSWSARQWWAQAAASQGGHGDECFGGVVAERLPGQ